MDLNRIKDIYGDGVEIRRLSGVRVMTPEGFKTVQYIKRSKAQGYYRVCLSNTGEIKCSGSHKVLLNDGHFLYVSQVSKGTVLHGNVEILEDPQWIEEETYLYDLLDVDGDIYTTVNGVVNHNCAFIDNIETTMAAAMPTLSTGGQVMLLSTPNGMGNYYHRMWTDAETGRNSFTAVKLPWQVHPERDQKWRDQQDADLGPRTAAQECVKGDSLITLYDEESDLEIVCSIEGVYRNIDSGIKCTYKILTPSGYRTFYGVRKVHKEFWYKISFTDGTELGTSDNHRLQLKDGSLLEVQYLREGQVIRAADGVKILKSIQRIDTPVDLYDALEVDGGHLYYTNSIVSRNCDCDFLTSGDTFFEPENMLFYEETYQMDPVERRGVDKGMWIWEYPDYSKSYLVSADVARGDGKDFSTFHVWDIEAATQVAEYQGQLPPREFGAVLVSVATEYNNALLSVENASIGWSTIEEIMARNYPNLYYSSTKSNETVESYSAKLDNGKLVPGFNMSSLHRPLALSSFADYVRQHGVIIRSKRLLLEMRTFVWINNKAQAANGYHDDLVMAAAQGLYIRDTALKLRQQGMDLSRASLQSFGNLNRRDTAVMKTNYQVNNPYKIQTGYGQQEDITWLLG